MMENINKEITLDDLALIIAGRIDIMEEKMEKRFDKIETNAVALKSTVEEIKTTVGNIETNLNKKVDIVDHNTLTYRVEKLEKKFA